MNRRSFTKVFSLIAAALVLPLSRVQAKTYLTIEQARKLLWGDMAMQKVTVALSKAQAKSIRSASGTRVRNRHLQAWKTANGGWFIVDQVIGKHENIDLAFALTPDGKVKGLEILVYRETYGFEIQHPKWRGQFHGKGHDEILKLDKHIKNISGATLSCRHVTDGINRLTHTWNQVLKHL